MLPACRLLIDPPASGAWNMAVDEMLLETVDAEGGCWWRFYRWEQPTLSLGYFQTVEDRDRHMASRSCPVVRRLSGGGAILHDAELTYSFVVAADHHLAKQRERLYQTVHEALVEVLAGLGVEACPWGDRRPDASETNPFLCFQRRAPGDLVLGDVKIAGSAQRRGRDAVLQHGSVLLAQSKAAPELAGLTELSGRAIDGEVLVQPWLAALGNRLELDFAEASLSDAQRARAAALVRTKYAADDWTVRRGRTSNITKVG
jgi:lipoate-protein ligase A